MKGEGGGRRVEGGGRSRDSQECSVPPSALHPPPSLCILLLGNTRRTEFHGAQPCLERWGAVHAMADVAAATAALTEGAVLPDVIVIAQAFPGQFSHQAIDRLRRLAPLAPVVGLMGSWCEGELRSGSPWPAVVRTYWHQWTARCHRQLGRLALGECGCWTLPPTATEEERLLADADCSRHTPCADRMSKPGPSPCGLVLICSPSREMARWLSAACRSRGFATVWQRPPVAARVEGARAAIFDAASLNEDGRRDLQSLAASLHPAPVIALLAFPRVEDYRLARSAGAAMVVSKPLAVDDLFWELERVERGEWRVERGEGRGERGE